MAHCTKNYTKYKIKVWIKFYNFYHKYFSHNVDTHIRKTVQIWNIAHTFFKPILCNITFLIDTDVHSLLMEINEHVVVGLLKLISPLYCGI